MVKKTHTYVLLIEISVFLVIKLRKLIHYVDTRFLE